ncbi:hypothetical protein MUK42_21553 [Musa troglodytarum]|uniref:Uncharacterized protein n=1 Tax=Musa troglodytarum TaxID=320322 RepID=A0A9E7G3D7_9LILI|nr:hypothetical protein MUK42_21553 [Musa troglodytarum]
MTVEDDSASRPWFAARRRSGKRKRSADAVLQQRQGSPVVPPSSDIEEYYSRAYSQIKDHARMEAYRDGILRHQPLISGKVYAVDESTLAARFIGCPKAIFVNDVSIDEKVDVIISDWMGDMLLHKSKGEKRVIDSGTWGSS